MESNVQKMREALETVLNLAYEVQDANSEYGPKTSIPTQFIIDVIKPALSASPRNCDLYKDEQSARAAFSNARQGPDSSTEEYEKWLFATAETKGENE